MASKLDLFGFLQRESRNVWNKYVHNDVERWRKVYSQSYRDRLESCDQRSRHYLIAGAVRELLPTGAKILDVGCGCGTTCGMLSDYPFYHGIDVAAAAIEACKKAFPERPDAFEVADFETYELDAYDAVIFNEVLYYFPLRKLSRLVRKTLDSLQDNKSLLIVSMSKTLKSRLVWKKLESVGRPIQATSLAARAIGSRWNVKVYQPLAESTAAPVWYRSLSTALLFDSWHDVSLGSMADGA
jgi:2-polyprenyl-3-methyl-5-hydroxy-6-metoxy-1,4-benzoquinol methylase